MTWFTCRKVGSTGRGRGESGWGSGSNSDVSEKSLLLEGEAGCPSGLYEYDGEGGDDKEGTEELVDAHMVVSEIFCEWALWAERRIKLMMNSGYASNMLTFAVKEILKLRTGSFP
jgi:hypothetical protein